MHPASSALVAETFRKRERTLAYKQLLERHGLLQRWFEFEAAETEIALRRWCEENDLQINARHAAERGHELQSARYAEQDSARATLAGRRSLAFLGAPSLNSVSPSTPFTSPSPLFCAWGAIVFAVVTFDAEVLVLAVVGTPYRVRVGLSDAWHQRN